LIATHQEHLSGFNDKIMPIHSRGIRTRDITRHWRELDGIEVSLDPISQSWRRDWGEARPSAPSPPKCGESSPACNLSWKAWSGEHGIFDYEISTSDCRSRCRSRAIRNPSPSPEGTPIKLRPIASTGF